MREGVKNASCKVGKIAAGGARKGDLIWYELTGASKQGQVFHSSSLYQVINIRKTAGKQEGGPVEEQRNISGCPSG